MTIEISIKNESIDQANINVVNVQVYDATDESTSKLSTTFDLKSEESKKLYLWKNHYVIVQEIESNDKDT